MSRLDVAPHSGRKRASERASVHMENKNRRDVNNRKNRRMYSPTNSCPLCSPSSGHTNTFTDLVRQFPTTDHNPTIPGRRRKSSHLPESVCSSWVCLPDNTGGWSLWNSVAVFFLMLHYPDVFSWKDHKLWSNSPWQTVEINEHCSITSSVHIITHSTWSMTSDPQHCVQNYNTGNNWPPVPSKCKWARLGGEWNTSLKLDQSTDKRGWQKMATPAQAGGYEIFSLDITQNINGYKNCSTTLLNTFFRLTQ